jgi:hypothetical protein
MLIKEKLMDELLDELLVAILAVKEKAKIENISQDDYETMILDTLSSAGIEFLSR